MHVAATPGLTFNDSGFIGLSGAVLELAEAIDHRLLGLAAEFLAQAQQFGPLLAVEDLRQIDYFSSFPHLIAFPGRPARDAATLRKFAQANGANSSGPLFVGDTASIECVLTPAACYGVYIGLKGKSIDQSPQTITVRGTCFRAESTFVPLERQPSFSMREIVHLGDFESVQQFLLRAEDRVARVAAEWQLPISIAVATDPFFDPARSPKYRHAKLFPSKHELIQDGVALASFNNHRNFFGEAYRISRGEKWIHSACVAFGIERWVSAILRCHGDDAGDWPADLTRPKPSTGSV